VTPELRKKLLYIAGALLLVAVALLAVSYSLIQQQQRDADTIAVPKPPDLGLPNSGLITTPPAGETTATPGSTGTSGSPYTGPEPVYIGARGSSTAGDQSDPFRGTIDLVRLTKGILYNGPFTPPDLYRGGPKVNAVRLAWGGPATGLVNQYLVYRQELPSGANTLIGTLAYSPLPSLLDAAVTPELTYRYTVRATNSDGDPSSASAPLDVTMVVPTDVAGETAPGVSGPRLRLEPNPFNPTATITFRLERTGPVDLALYDARGRRVATVVHGNLPQGEHRVQVFGGRDARLASGVYFLSLRADGRDTRLKAVLVR